MKDADILGIYTLPKSDNETNSARVVIKRLHRLLVGWLGGWVWAMMRDACSSILQNVH